jgi:hypothetical protein
MMEEVTLEEPTENAEFVKQFFIKPEYWSELDVTNWFLSKNIHPDIVNSLRPCDGRILHQLFNMYTEAPDHFYKSIVFIKSSNELTPLRDVCKFTFELKTLFTN